MALLLGAITVDDMERTTVAQIGQNVVYDAAQQFLNRVNQDMEKALSIFVQGTTEEVSEAYKLPGSGTLQNRGGYARSGAVKAGGKWDVAYPLRDFGAAIATSDVELAYMTAQDFQLHVSTVIIQDRNTVRLEIMRRIFDNTEWTVEDEVTGQTLKIKSLANGDSVVYPPLDGEDESATANHFYVTGYAASAISDANNPVAYASTFLSKRFGDSPDADGVVWINEKQAAKISLIDGFEAVGDSKLRYGSGITVPVDLPAIPGRIIGRLNQMWVSVWNAVPENYGYAVRLGTPAPLKMRVDTVASGLPRGLALVDEMDNSTYPLRGAQWRHRFGLGAANRLNGLVIFFDAGSTYVIPSKYTF